MSQNDDSTADRQDAKPTDEPLGEGGLKALEAERQARRDAEKQAQQLGQRLTDLQRGEAERIAAESLADPKDLWLVSDIKGLVDEETGELSPERVREAVEGATQARPHWRKRAIVKGSADAGKGGSTGAGDDMDAIAKRLVGG